MRKQLTLDDYKKLLIMVLDDIDHFCQENSITYYLDSGTLLGAVRHKGFIPWDDDIDLAMPRKDYERFVKEYRSNKCTLFSYKNHNDYFYPYAKVVCNNTDVIELIVPRIEGLGVNIDIFPLDGMPNQLTLRRIHQDWLMFLNKLRAFTVKAKKAAPSYLQFLLRWRWLVRYLDKLGKKYPVENSKFCGNITATTVRHKEIPVSAFVETVMLEFEGKKYPAPGNFDKYLTVLYGDYMKLPPEEKRVVKHKVEAYIEE